jgi:hypothetical protein
MERHHQPPSPHLEKRGRDEAFPLDMVGPPTLVANPDDGQKRLRVGLQAPTQFLQPYMPPPHTSVHSQHVMQPYPAMQHHTYAPPSAANMGHHTPWQPATLSFLQVGSDLFLTGTVLLFWTGDWSGIRQSHLSLTFARAHRRCPFAPRPTPRAQPGCVCWGCGGSCGWSEFGSCPHF